MCIHDLSGNGYISKYWYIERDEKTSIYYDTGLSVYMYIYMYVEFQISIFISKHTSESIYNVTGLPLQYIYIHLDIYVYGRICAGSE